MKISVVIPVYNGEKYIAECIESVLYQTFTDYETIIVDDGSEDNTRQILEKLEKSDSRIRVIKNERHDFIGTLNTCLQEAKGEYVARIDADDTMVTDRLEKQVKLMDYNPSITVCSSWYSLFGESRGYGGTVIGNIKNPYLRFLIGDFVNNPSSILRKSFIDQHHIRYKEDYIYAEDYKFWVDIAKKGGRFHILPEPLTNYRIHAKQVSNVHQKEQADVSFQIKNEILNDLLALYEDKIEQIVPLFRMFANFNENNILSSDTIFRVAYEIIENHLRLLSV